LIIHRTFLRHRFYSANVVKDILLNVNSRFSATEAHARVTRVRLPAASRRLSNLNLRSGSFSKRKMPEAGINVIYRPEEWQAGPEKL